MTVDQLTAEIRLAILNLLEASKSGILSTCKGQINYLDDLIKKFSDPSLSYFELAEASLNIAPIPQHLVISDSQIYGASGKKKFKSHISELKALFSDNGKYSWKNVANLLKDSSSTISSAGSPVDKQILDLRTQLSAHMVEEAKLQQTIIPLREQASASQEEITKLHAQIGDLEKKVTALTEENGALYVKTLGIGPALPVAVNSIDIELATLRGTLAAQQQETAVLRSELATRKDELQRVIKEKAELSTALPIAQGKVSAHEKTIAALQAQLQAKNSNDDQLAQQKAELETLLTASKQRIFSLEQEATQASTALLLLRSEVTQLRQESKELQTRIAQFELASAQGVQREQTQQSKIIALEARLAQMESQLQESHAVNAKLKLVAAKKVQLPPMPQELPSAPLPLPSKMDKQELGNTSPKRSYTGNDFPDAKRSTLTADALHAAGNGQSFFASSDARSVTGHSDAHSHTTKMTAMTAMTGVTGVSMVSKMGKSVFATSTSDTENKLKEILKGPIFEAITACLNFLDEHAGDETMLDVCGLVHNFIADLMLRKSQPFSEIIRASEAIQGIKNRTPAVEAFLAKVSLLENNVPRKDMKSSDKDTASELLKDTEFFRGGNEALSQYFQSLRKNLRSVPSGHQSTLKLR